MNQRGAGAMTGKLALCRVHSEARVPFIVPKIDLKARAYQRDPHRISSDHAHSFPEHCWSTQKGIRMLDARWKYS
jgi:hypothetical protein